MRAEVAVEVLAVAGVFGRAKVGWNGFEALREVCGAVETIEEPRGSTSEHFT